MYIIRVPSAQYLGIVISWMAGWMDGWQLTLRRGCVYVRCRPRRLEQINRPHTPAPGLRPDSPAASADRPPATSSSSRDALKCQHKPRAYRTQGSVHPTPRAQHSPLGFTPCLLRRAGQSRAAPSSPAPHLAPQQTLQPAPVPQHLYTSPSGPFGLFCCARHAWERSACRVFQIDVRDRLLQPTIPSSTSDLCE